MNDIKKWFGRRKLDVSLITFSDEFLFGETIPSELERIASKGDAAIVLVTPDDVGRLASGGPTSKRARENVWLELGWFWARLGRLRTLMLIRGEVDLPSDTSGVLYLSFQNSVNEVSDKLVSFIKSINSTNPTEVPEILSSATSHGGRSGEYALVTESARSRVLIMGIGMANVRHDLENIFSKMRDKNQTLESIFLTPSLNCIRQNAQAVGTLYRDALEDDLRAFDEALKRLSSKYSDIWRRVQHIESEKLFTFSGTVADPGEMGSLMLVETILPTEGFHSMQRPRFLLRRRTRDGLYDRYLAAMYGYIPKQFSGIIFP